MLGWTSSRFFRRAWFQVNLALWNGGLWRLMVCYYLLLAFIWTNFPLCRPSPTRSFFPPHLGFCAKDFSRAPHVWHLALVRGDVGLLSRAGDQESTDLGWIPDFITELQHDLGWGLGCLHYLLPTSVVNGPYPWPNSPWSLVHHQCTKSHLSNAKWYLTPQRCFISCGWICSPVVFITVALVCSSVSEQYASLLVSRKKKPTTPSVSPLSTATHCCHRGCLSLLFHLVISPSQRTIMTVSTQIFHQFLIFFPSLSFFPPYFCRASFS